MHDKKIQIKGALPVNILYIYYTNSCTYILIKKHTCQWYIYTNISNGNYYKTGNGV